MSDLTFGARVAAADSPHDVLTLEEQEGRSSEFAELDVAVAGVMIRALGGERVVRLSKTDRKESLEIVGIPDTLRASLDEAFQLEAQQARGAWFLPESVPIKAHTLLFSALFREQPRYAHTLAIEEKGKLALSGNPDAMIVWSVFEPLSTLLLAPVLLRVERSGLLSREEFEDSWTKIEAPLAALGLSLGEELRPFRWGGGWARFSIEEQLACKAGFLAALAAQTNVDVARRYRAMVTRKLVGKYYAKAKKGRAKRRQVVTKEFAPALAGFFAGDWLGFVRYLGEQPHDEERIVTALPEPKVMVSGKNRAAELAAKKGVSVEEVERIIGAFWSDADGSSPVLERVGVFIELWGHLDAIHAQQAPGMVPLWGLIEDGGWSSLESQAHTPYQNGLHRRLLPPELVAKVDRLWGTTVLAKWPDRIVGEPFPHSVMAETLGPALKFWHGCALTAWFVCEGPMSRTDIPGLAHHHRRELGELQEMQCPVHPQLFEDLNRVRLGPEEPIYSNDRTVDAGHGVSIGISTSSGSRRKGFESLRDVITTHRRHWVSQHFESYVRALWEVELRATARQYHLMTEEKGKPPTVKQFAKHAMAPARHWFGGDLGLLYASIGQKLPGRGVQRALRMPADRVAFANQVFAALGGAPIPARVALETPEERARQDAEHDRHNKLRRLAAESLWFVQLVEALERPPTLKEFGSKFKWQSEVLANDIDAAWATYSRVVQGVLVRLGTG